MIQQQYKKLSQTPEKECVLQFLNLVWSFYKYDEEQFKCSIGVSRKKAKIVFIFSHCYLVMVLMIL